MSPQIFVCPVFSKDIFNSRYIIRRKFYVYAFGWIITYIACSVDCISRDKYNISSGKRIKLVVQGNCTITINEIKKFIICMTVCRAVSYTHLWQNLFPDYLFREQDIFWQVQHYLQVQVLWQNPA